MTCEEFQINIWSGQIDYATFKHLETCEACRRAHEDVQSVLGGLRAMEDVDEKLAHELSDCLWSVLVLARKYNIDLSKEFMKTMDDLDKRIDTDMAAS